MSTSYSADTAHREIVLEQHLVEQLVARQGYLERSPEDYDRASALDREQVVAFRARDAGRGVGEAGGALHHGRRG